MFRYECRGVTVKGEETPRCGIFGKGKTWQSPLSAVTGTCVGRHVRRFLRVALVGHVSDGA